MPEDFQIRKRNFSCFNDSYRALKSRHAAITADLHPYYVDTGRNHCTSLKVIFSPRIVATSTLDCDLSLRRVPGPATPECFITSLLHSGSDAMNRLGFRVKKKVAPRGVYDAGQTKMDWVKTGSTGMLRPEDYDNDRCCRTHSQNL